MADAALSSVASSLASLCNGMHGSIRVGAGFSLGNTVDTTAADNFMAGASAPSLLGMGVRAMRISEQSRAGGAPPADPQCMCQAVLDGLIGQNSSHTYEFVVLAVSDPSPLGFFTGVKLKIIPLNQFISVFGSLYSRRPEWTLGLICSDVLASLKCGGESLLHVVLFSKTMASCTPVASVSHLLTSAFAFELRGFPSLRHEDLKSARRPHKVVPVVPPFFRNSSDRGLTPASAMVEMILSLAHVNWKVVVPPQWMGPQWLKFLYTGVKGKTKDTLRLAVCRFILRIRHDTLVAHLNGLHVTDDGDLYAACDALRLSLVIENEVAEDCPSPFLLFLKACPGLEKCVPWTWVSKNHHRKLDVLIQCFGACGFDPPAQSTKPVGLDAQQLSDRVVQPPPLDTDPSGLLRSATTLGSLMSVIERYLLVLWRPGTGPDSSVFFGRLSSYLHALADPHLRVFLTPRVWGFYLRNEGFLLPLAEHFLSSACVPARTSWVVPEDVVIMAVKRKPEQDPSDAGEFPDVGPRVLRRRR
jgi:hypothetical protein